MCIRDRLGVFGHRYDILYDGSRWLIIFNQPTTSTGNISGAVSGVVGANFNSVDGVSLSTAATGTDADTLYFRTTNGGEVFHGSDKVSSIYLGGSEIIRVVHGTSPVYITPPVGRPLSVTSTFNSGQTLNYTISWSSLAIDGTPPYTYRIQTDFDADFLPSTRREYTIESSAATVSISINNSSPKHFRFRVRAENGAGNGPWSSAERF